MSRQISHTLLQPASEIPACYVRQPTRFPSRSALHASRRAGSSVLLHAQWRGSIPCMPPESEMHMLKAARQGGPRSQGCKMKQGAAIAARSGGARHLHNTCHRSHCRPVSQHHRNPKNKHKLHSQFSSFTLSPCCSRLVDHGLAHGEKQPFKAPNLEQSPQVM